MSETVMNKITGYELVKGILCRSGDDLELLLKCAQYREREWLEFKAGIRLLNEDGKEKPDDLYWNVTEAVIAIMNTAGGAVVIGISDTPELKVVPLETCDPQEKIRKFGIEKYLREEIQNKICPVKKRWKTSKGEYSLPDTKVCIEDHLEFKTVRWQGHEIAMILIKPVDGEFVMVRKNENEEILFARKKGVGEVNAIRFSGPIRDYEQEHDSRDPEYAALLDSAFPSSAGAGEVSFFDSWKVMIQQLEGMESLLGSNEHDALQYFCGIIEKAIGDLGLFCGGPCRGLSLAESEIHQVWAQLRQSNLLREKLNISAELKFPDLSCIETLKELDRQQSWKLKPMLSKLYWEWWEFAKSLADCFPSSAGQREPTVQHNLPREGAEFIGREEQLNEILRFLSRREKRNYFLMITGEGGMGKSTLALAAAYAVLARDPKTSGVASEDLAYQNIVWASAKERDFQDQHEYVLTPDIEDHEGLLNTILNVLAPGHSLADLNAKQNSVHQILQKTQSLLIIDNMETIRDDRLFDYLKNKIPSPTKIIGTDRNRAKTDRVIKLPPMSRDECKSLVKSLASEKASTFSEEDFDRFYKLSYGIPKVIEWGCRFMNTHVAGIEDVFRYLTEAQMGTKNQIYEYLFGFSYERLSAAAKKVLNILALFDFPVQCRLIGPLAEIERGIDEYIDELSSYTLLLVSCNGERSILNEYACVQDYIRNYAAVKADSSDEINKVEVYARAKKIFLNDLVRVCGTIGWPHQEAYGWCKNNQSMIRWLFSRLIEDGNISDIHRFVMSVIPVLSNIGMPADVDFFCSNSLAVILNIVNASAMEFHDLIELMLRAFRGAGGELKSTAADILGQWAWNMFRQARNNFVEVSEILNAICAASSEINNPHVTIMALRNLALIDKEQIRLDEAEEKLLHVVEECRVHGELHIEAITYGSLGSLYRDKNDLARACDYMKLAFGTLEKIEDQDSVKEVLSVFYQKYAKLMIKSGRTEEAQNFIEKAMEIDRRIGRQYGFAHNKRLQAIIYEQKKDFSQAYRLICEARDIFIRLNSGKEVEEDYEKIRKEYEAQQFT